MILSTRYSGVPSTTTGPGRSREREGNFSSSLGLKGLTCLISKVGKRLGAGGISRATVDFSGKEPTTSKGPSNRGINLATRRSLTFLYSLRLFKVLSMTL